MTRREQDGGLLSALVADQNSQNKNDSVAWLNPDGNLSWPQGYELEDAVAAWAHVSPSNQLGADARRLASDGHAYINVDLNGPGAVRHDIARLAADCEYTYHGLSYYGWPG